VVKAQRAIKATTTVSDVTKLTIGALKALPHLETAINNISKTSSPRQVGSTPRWEFRGGDHGGPHGPDAITTIISLTGNRTYYNSDVSGGFKLDEPDSYIQLQRRLSKSNLNGFQIGLNWFKEKYRNDKITGFGIEAPTAFQLSMGENKKIVDKGIGPSIYANFSVGAGVELGFPRNTDGNISFNFKPILKKYGIVGYGVSFISRIDFEFFHRRFVSFVAGTLHGMETKSFTSTSGILFKGSGSVSAGLAFGVGFNLGR
jgi:hypothetical protein